MAATENNEEFIEKAFLKLTENYIQHGAVINDLQSITMTANAESAKNRSFATRSKKLLVILFVPFFYGIFNRYFYTNIMKSFQGTRCLLPNNYLVWEFTRPITNCDYCRDVEAPLILPNLTKEEFRFYSYSSRPMIIKNAAYNWPARREFTLEFFRNLYERIEGAYESVEEECQFLHFKSNFANLREVFAMSEDRALHREGEDPWYVGWKNCHPQILDAMKRFYNVPHFLPDDAEIPYSNYIFIGYEEGAVMHLDYISRLMWQAQVIGSKTWTVAPTPECDSECKSFKFSVNVTDVVLLDTRIWYHSTHIENGNLSLTVTSEYG
ncbi:PREDICTED: uncharacterized protein LOC105454670 [Wasmannia auropunctata]|uniref:uncharacterized protein LOC105454670 n=1 Tax=Wasmannia auropunctata TaxID=64793 RepID=UPI0005EF94C3|nr:PREDICTED: uncharacterized protein LOC105454670 [Wasmannia auropunctata]XP_011695773.1 PREDICTED: uncharacterized protein LOC105454670 [Wasmannia auropunctata]XP_011695774.1 PREDICTED: uncharacterized protein LOC105454670 [Wasmannia auropunctata]